MYNTSVIIVLILNYLYIIIYYFVVCMDNIPIGGGITIKLKN